MSPAGQFKGHDKDYLTLAMVVAEMADKNLSEDLAYKIVKSVYAERMEVTKVDAAMREGGLERFPQLSVDYCDVPLHPGTIKFFRELGVKVPDKLIPPEMK